MVMRFMIKRRIPWFWVAVVLIVTAILVNLACILFFPPAVPANTENCKFIKWVDFTATTEVMEQTMKLDIESQKTNVKLNWVDLIAYLAAKYGGNFKQFKSKDLDAVAEKLQAGTPLSELTKDMKYYDYYREAYGAVLDGLVGSYKIQTTESLEKGTVEYEEKYGLKAYSPIAYGYSFAHYDDFGNPRSYGYRRNHLGHDLMSSIGTPIIAVESGVVEELGWNRFGGWRVGIRSFDGKRFFYYAHMRKDRPYHAGLKKGAVVKAGDVIGYLGMTGYSDTENVNGMNVPHLHFGMQLIFDPSQNDGTNEIWIDTYQLVSFLEHHKSPVVRNDDTKEYYRKYAFIDPAVEALNGNIPQFATP